MAITATVIQVAAASQAETFATGGAKVETRKVDQDILADPLRQVEDVGSLVDNRDNVFRKDVLGELRQAAVALAFQANAGLAAGNHIITEFGDDKIDLGRGDFQQAAIMGQSENILFGLAADVQAGLGDLGDMDFEEFFHGGFFVNWLITEGARKVSSSGDPASA